jgi:hypothetical protein
VASETHVPETAVRAGAAETAPTAPHATPSSAKKRRKTGPERFWDLRRLRIAMVVCACLSVGFHWWMTPWTMRSGLTFEIKDTEGDVAIPVDLIAEEPPPPPEPVAPAPPVADPSQAQADSIAARDAAPPRQARDAGPPDAEADAEAHDAAVATELTDGGAVPLLADGGAIALADAAPPGAGGPRDPEGLIGAAGELQAGTVLVTLLINVEVIRAHPAGPRLSKIARAAPQWDEALKGTTVDPVRDADWVLVSGPSLRHTERDVILVRYSVPDALADEAIESIRKRSHNGAGYDAGVPGVKATLAHADRFPRVFLRPQSHLIAVVPPDFAATAAKGLAKKKIQPHVRPGEAMRLIVKNPHNAMPMLPQQIKVLTVWVQPLADGGAEVFGEGECDGPTSAGDAAAEISGFLQKYRGSLEGAFANVVSRGLINALDVSADGKLVRAHAHANKEQVDAIISFVAAQLGVDTGAPPAPAPSR